MGFHVYVEGAVDATSDGVAQLAVAISQKFGLPANEIQTRLATGRFRVKANVDRATAETYLKTLKDLGAKAKIEEAAPGSGPTSLPRTGGSSLPPPSLPRTNTGSSLPPPPAGSAKAAQMASGLAAAFTQNDDAAPADLGALGGESLSLASLDGNEDGSAPVSNTIESAENAGFAASIGPAALPAPAPTNKTKSTSPIDLFAPPDAEAAEAQVELAAEAPSAPTSPVLRKSQPSLQPPVMGGTAAPVRELTRAQWGAGVILAILIGFVPAHFVASVREKSAFTEIDNNVKRTQELATDDQAYAALDGFRAAQLSEKQSKQRSIMLTSLLLWAAVSAGMAYVWMKRVPWEKFSKTA